MGAWYEESFGDDYLLVYRHRDFQGAYREVQSMIRWLSLPEGAKVLDLCCGMGRHALALADFGFRVTGVDLSGVLLEKAKQNDPAGRVRWVQGDMRSVPLEETFDAVVNLFTSFGYFENDGDNQKVLGEIRRLLKRGGKFIIDYLNPQYVKRHLDPRSVRGDGETRIEEERAIEDGFVTKRIRISEPGKPVRRYLERVKLYERKPFEEMLKKAGLAVDRVFGDYAGTVYEPARSPRMIFVGRRMEEKAEGCCFLHADLPC